MVKLQIKKHEFQEIVNAYELKPRLVRADNFAVYYAYENEDGKLYASTVKVLSESRKHYYAYV